MKKILLTLASGFLFTQAYALQITQKASGKALEVTPSNVTETEVTFLLNGKSYTVPLDSLTAESVSALQASAKAESEVSFTKINEAIGHNLFGESDLWDEKAAEIAGRLNWKKESLKESNSSYRKYPQADYRFLGARPYSVTIYGGPDDTPEHLSLVFANKGDFNSTVGSGADHFKKAEGEKVELDLNDAIKIDETALETTLTAALGEPVEQYYGEKEAKRKVQRWDIGGQSFLMSAEKGEYVHLLVVRTENADAEGKVKFIKDAVVKASHLKNVRQDDNGDVWIDNIPMVNQGPKGYCAPATFERAMRYMNVPADMYLLATAATTAGGGTNTQLLAKDAKRIVRSKARRIKDISLGSGLKIRDVKSYIDEGVPVLWQMRSLKAYNKIANERTKERTSITDFEAWAETIQNEADETVGQLRREDNHHICLIIGYNEETNELAVSDSWGPQYELRWVHTEIAAAVTSTQSGGFVIDF